jgi:PAS domain-containing protein
MSERQHKIGYNRTVKLQWLNETLDLFLRGKSDAEIYGILSDRLSNELSVGSQAQRGSREKTITLLMKTWVRVPPPLREFRNDGLQLLREFSREDRLIFHWGMTVAVYPFWRVVADVIGRLFRLQGSATPMQVQRRVKELLGEREAVARSTRYVLRAFSDWGVILDSSESGTYCPAPPISLTELRSTVWLLEATLLSLPDNVSDFRALLNAPSLFPFQLSRLFPEQLAVSNRFEAVRHSLEETVIRPRTPLQGLRTAKKLREVR